MMKQKIRWRNVLWIGLILVFVLTGCTQSGNEEPKQKLKIGILPVDDSLPLIVAEQQGYFDHENLDVELIPFQSSVESQSAIQSGQIDGMIADMVVAILLKDSGLNVKMTTIIAASQELRRFAVLSAPNSGIEKIEDLKGKSIGISTNSIIEYITDKFFEQSGIDPTAVEKTSIPKIPVRMEMLISNQIDAITIPEPLASFAELQKANVVIDDTSSPEISQVTLIMTEQALNKNVNGFFQAYEKALKEINANPNQFKETLINNINIPEPVIEIYQVSTYPELQLPSEKDVNDVLEWLNEKGLLKNPIEYQDLIQTGLY